MKTDPTRATPTAAPTPNTPRSAHARSLAARALSVAVLLSLAHCSPPPGEDAGVDVRPPRDRGDPTEDVEEQLDGESPDAVDPMDMGTATDGPITPTDSGPSPLTETCPATFRMCTPAAGAASTALVRVRGTVVSPDRVFCDGEVLFSRETGRILCAGDDCSSSPGAADAQVICGNGVIYPGLIDPHQHADYNHMPVFQHTARYDNRNTWRNHEPLYDGFKIPHRPFGSTMRDNQVLAQRYAEMRIAMAGGTAMSGTAGVLLSNPGIGGWIRNVDSTQATASMLADRASVDPDTDTILVRESDGMPNGTAAVTRDTMDHVAGILSRMSAPTYRAFLPHLGEGLDINARTEFDIADMLGVITTKTGVIHCTACSARQFARLAAAGGALIWSPRSNVDLYGQTANVTVAKALGVPIALGVDWTPSGSMNPVGELQCAARLNDRYYNRTFTDRDLVSMSTVNGAIAMGLDDQIGALREGLFADMAVIAGDRTRPYRALIDSRPEQVRLVVIAGKAIYGDPDAATGAVTQGMICTPVPDGLSPPGMTGVCGRPKSVCATPNDIGGLRTMMSGILSTARSADAMCNGATPASYCYGYELFPLFQCSGPELARCDFGHGPITRRAMGGGMIAAVSGTPMPGTDDDGDSVPNAMDNCPRIFNTPFDNGTTQEDTDGDGMGDVCDPQPCVGAGGMNACPNTAPVDPCIMNPMAPGCMMSMPMAATLTIPVLRNPAAMGHPAANSRITVNGAVVTGVKSSGSNHGFFIQDATARSWAGVYIFVGTATVSVAVGDTVNVTGVYTTFNGLEQLNASAAMMGTVMRTGAGTVPTPLVVTPADIAPMTGARRMEYQSMLLRLENVTAITATSGTDFRVGATATTPSAMGAIVTSFVATDTAASPFPATMGQRYASITGLLYAFTDPKLAPRNAMDIVAGM